QIALGFDTARCQADSGLKGLFDFSCKEETATFLSLRAINSPEPSLVFRILWCQLDRVLGIRDGLIIVMLFVVGPGKPIVNGGILRRSFQRGRQQFLCLYIPACSKMRVCCLQRLLLGLSWRTGCKGQRNQQSA